MLNKFILLSGVMGDDVGFYDAVAGIMCFGQCVRVGCNVSPEILIIGPFTVDYFLVIVDERVAFPVGCAPQLATGISRRLEAGEQPIALRVRVPPDRDEPTEISVDSANGMAFGHQRGPAPS